MPEPTASTLSGVTDIDLPEFDAPPEDPVRLAMSWLAAAEAYPVREPRSAVLATAGRNGNPTSRVVSVKGIAARGVVFTSALTTHKAADMAENPHVSITFYWRETMQQLNVRGEAVQLSGEASDALFLERPRGAQVASIVSAGGLPLADEEELAARAAALEHATTPLTRPSTWAGYLIVPARIEFWQGRVNRMHRRLVYTGGAGQWSAQRLQP
ncbi:pyridoxal 5'-phosphate synthase [Rathayibacter soli]|uniref:pyridoxal 5'-phosphate synthase n=1 Tax=Rathayibacter soli TaxID=3144168 RepID=UPI0027E48756|nr:pyridoxal 5'-phosphate synthase [Glaciibacter superstes]